MVEPRKSYFVLRLSYDGTLYSGFQEQKGSITVQSTLNAAVKEMLDIEGALACAVTSCGASRTDAGVHALEQLVRVTVSYPLSEDSDSVPTLRNLNDVMAGFSHTSLNCYLPSNICCTRFSMGSKDVLPQGSVRCKEYRYYFTNIMPSGAGGLESDRNANPFAANFALPLNQTVMKNCLENLVGTHDFKNFFSSGSNVCRTVRTVIECSLTEINPLESEGTVFSGVHQPLFQWQNPISKCFEFRIIGDGFLKQMVRHIVASLWAVGCGRITTSEWALLLMGSREESGKCKPWKVAPARGLFLYKLYDS